MLVQIDNWPQDSHYPRGHYIKVIGTEGEREVCCLSNTDYFYLGIHQFRLKMKLYCLSMKFLTKYSHNLCWIVSPECRGSQNNQLLDEISPIAIFVRSTLKVGFLSSRKFTYCFVFRLHWYRWCSSLYWFGQWHLWSRRSYCRCDTFRETRLGLGLGT